VRPSGTSQIDKFRDLARELEADEDEERFEETVRKIAPKTPQAPQGSEDHPKK
jgi:hypothetical protein